MIDLVLLRENKETIKKLLLKKEPTFNVDELLEKDSLVRRLKTEVESLRKQRNDISKSASREISEQVRAQSIELGKKLKTLETDLKDAEENLMHLAASCPNIPAEDVPVGGKEKNEVIKIFQTKPTFEFTPKNHVELNEKLGWFDFDAAARMSGSHFVLYRGMGARLLYALTSLMMKINQKHGFELIIPPYLVSEKALFNASNFPKFKDQVYSVKDDNLYLIPTAEVSLTNLYADHIFNAEELPVRMCSWTSCFRREAGGYGGQERGLIRIHQFEKVELYTISTPEKSEHEHEKMLACAEEIVQTLNLHYRVSLLAGEDCSFPSAKTYDLEVWLAGQGSYYEVSSLSNCTTFQARRSAIRFRKSAEEKPHLVHTLNASSLALPRLMVALMETYQKADGTIELPAILQEELDGWN